MSSSLDTYPVQRAPRLWCYAATDFYHQCHSHQPRGSGWALCVISPRVCGSAQVRPSIIRGLYGGCMAPSFWRPISASSRRNLFFFLTCICRDSHARFIALYSSPQSPRKRYGRYGTTGLLSQLDCAVELCRTASLCPLSRVGFGCVICSGRHNCAMPIMPDLQPSLCVSTMLLDNRQCFKPRKV